MNESTTVPPVRTPITRRSAIRSGGLAAIAAGLLGTAGTRPATAEPAPRTATVSLADGTPPVDAAWYADWRERRTAASAEHEEAWKAIEARLGHDGWELLNHLETAASLTDLLETDLLVEKMAVHLPGLAGAIRLVYQHLLESGVNDRVLGCCQHVSSA